MARLPIPGQDENSWGEVLNDFLSIEHNLDGSLRKATDIAQAVADAGAARSGLQLFAQSTWKNARQYGARGDGQTDDTAAIQAAIDDATQGAQSTYGGGTVYLPAGLYLISSTLVLQKHVWLRGEGINSSTIKLKRNANCHVVRNKTATSSNGSNADYTALIDLCLDGNSSEQGGSDQYDGVHFETNPRGDVAAGDSFFDMHHLIQNVKVYRAKGDGFHFDGRSAIQVINAFASECTRYSYFSTFDTNYSHCESDGAGSDGFFLNNGSIRLSNCKSYLSGQVTHAGAGYHISSNATGVSLAACEAQNNYGQGFYLEGCDRVNLAGCVADSNNFDAVNTYPGIELLDSSYNTILGNSSQGRQNNVQVGNQRNALRITGSSAFNAITLSHSANTGTTVDAALTGDSTLTTSHVVINGQVQP